MGAGLKRGGKEIPRMSFQKLQTRLRALADPADAAFLAKFFKTAPGQYGAGDVFLGIRVPVIRKVAGQFADLSLADTGRLLRSKFHEERLAALAILVLQAKKADVAARREIYDFYLANTAYVNNWDLVDLSAPQVVGAYLAERGRKPLDRLAKSKSLWERRISIVATFHFIRLGQFDDTLRIAETLLADREDLIHKAVGWMLREVGKRDESVLEEFLERCHRTMPRTMLRYAIERLPASQRRRYMARG
jgi:3-methyladenine DNA glycosylase AlkD